MTKRTVDEMTIVRLMISGKSLNFRVFFIKRPTTRAYATATTDASVGVKTPSRIPPMMIKGKTSEIIAPFRAVIDLREAGPPVMNGIVPFFGEEDRSAP